MKCIHSPLDDKDYCLLYKCECLGRCHRYKDTLDDIGEVAEPEIKESYNSVALQRLLRKHTRLVMGE